MANPKNPVRAARQASRQTIRTAKTARRQDERTAKTEKKVENIAARTATKVAKISGTAKPTASAPKFKTAEELKSTIKMPDFKSRIVEMAKDKAKASGTGTKAPVAKTTPKSSPEKTPTPKVKKETPKKETPKATPAPVEAYKDNSKQEKVDRLNKTFGSLYNPDANYTDSFTRSLRESQYYENDKIAKRELNERRAKRGLPPLKAGGPVKKYQMGGMAVKPPRSIRGTKASPSDMRQPFPKPAVRPGNTVRPPKSVRKAGPSTPASMMKSMKKGGMIKRKK